MAALASILIPALLMLGVTVPDNRPEVLLYRADTTAVPADTSFIYAILPYDSAYFRFFPRKGTPSTGYKPTELSPGEIAICYDVILYGIDTYYAKDGGTKIDATTYYFQIIPAISRTDEKVVHINAVCRTVADHIMKDEEALNWRTYLLETDDGGRCFFNATVNLDRRQLLRFSVNGPG